jgi:UDP-glucose 6-dehydrogenase
MYAKGEELWEKVIMTKTDNIKNMLENHYQIVLNPELLSEGIESSDAL